MGRFLIRGWFGFGLLMVCWSCVGTKKHQTLKTERAKLTRTLLETKEQLSVAKRQLNKLQDVSSSSQAQKDASIEQLSRSLKETQTLLRQVQQKNNTLAQQLEQSASQHKAERQRYEQQLSPLVALQAQLTQQQRTLRLVDQALQQAISTHNLEGIQTALLPGRLVIRLDNVLFFGSSNHAITNKGREHLKQLAVIFNQHTTPYIDLKGNVSNAANSKDNWKNSTRYPLAILYALLKEQVLPNRFRVLGQGEYQPLSGIDVASNRTELVLHFQPERSLETIPLR